MVCFISSSSTSSVSVFVIFQAGVPFSIENVLWLFPNLHTFGALSTGPNNAIGTKIDKYQVWEWGTSESCWAKSTAITNIAYKTLWNQRKTTEIGISICINCFFLQEDINWIKKYVYYPERYLAPVLRLVLISWFNILAVNCSHSVYQLWTTCTGCTDSLEGYSLFN